MTTKEQQVKNSFIYMLPIVTGSILPLITLAVFTRILTKEDYGVLALAQIYAIFVTGLANFGMTIAYDRNYFQHCHNHLQTAKVLYSALLFVTLNFLVLAGLTYLFKGLLSEYIIGSARHANLLFWALCAQFIVGVRYYYLTYLKNSEAAKSFVAYTIAAGLINLVLALFFVVYLRVGILGIVYAQLLSGAMILCILIYRFAAILTPSVDKAILCELLKIGYPLTPRIFLGVIGTQFNKYIIGLLASVGGVGIYSIGQQVAYVVFSFMTAIQNVFSPQVYRKMFDLEGKGGEAVGRYLTPFAYVSISVGLMISLFSEEVISILTPQSYHGAIDIVIVLNMFYASMFFGKQPQLIFAKKTGIISILTMVGLGLSVALNIPFIIKWGAVGAAWATLLAAVISGAISFAVSQHYYRIEWEYRKLGAIFLTFFGFSIAMILLRAYGIVYPIRLVVKCLALGLYSCIGVKVRVVTRENYFLVRNMLVSNSAA